MSTIPIDIDVSEEFGRLHAKISDFVRTVLDPISLQVETEERIPEETVADFSACRSPKPTAGSG